MKRIIFCLIILLVSAGSAWTQNLTEEEIIENDCKGVLLTITPFSYPKTPDMVELTLSNQTDNTIQFGAPYTIEKYNPCSEEWEEITFPEGIAFISIMYMLPAGESEVYNTYLYLEQISYDPGLYQIKKQIYSEDKNIECTAQFEIEQ